jgi:excisionase family DNA binding protein
MSNDEHTNEQPEWMDLRAIRRYACVSERTLREWIHRPVDPLPAVRVGTKILVYRSTFDAWLGAHQVKRVDLGIIVDELVAGLEVKD